AALRDEVKRQEEAAVGADASRAKAAARRLAELDGLITRATERFLSVEDEADAEACRKQIAKWRAHASTVAAQVRVRVAPAVAGRVDAAMAELEALAARFGSADPAEVAAAVRENVTRVEVWTSSKRQPTISKGLVYIREDSTLCSLLSSTPGST